MSDPHVTLADLRKGGDGLCKHLHHFPERVYEWSLTPQMRGKYYAHCAICGTDYALLHYTVLTPVLERTPEEKP